MFTTRQCLLIFPFLAFLTPAVAGEALSLQVAQQKSLGIETAVVGEATAVRDGMLPARVIVPNEQLRIVTAPIAGMVELLAVAPGSTVKRGQVVARLASPQALELQRDVLQTSSQSSLMQQNLRRDEQLFAEGLIAESRLQATRAAAAQASAQADERRHGLALAGMQPGRLGGPLALTAPIDGVVLEQGVQLGQRVEGSALIYRIARLSPLWLEIQAPLAVASRLREGMPIKLNANVTGRLIALGRAVDPASQTVLLRAIVTKGAETLTPGQVVEVEMPSAVHGSVRLPASAVARHDGKAYVFVHTSSTDKEIRFEPRIVEVSRPSGDSVQVDNIQSTERIAIKGVSGLKAMFTGVGRQ